MNISAFGWSGVLELACRSLGEADTDDERHECGFECEELECTFDIISIFSSFSSSKSFNSRTSDSSALTLSSSDSVYPRGLPHFVSRVLHELQEMTYKALRDNLSEVLHSNPTVEH